MCLYISLVYLSGSMLHGALSTSAEPNPISAEKSLKRGPSRAYEYRIDAGERVASPEYLLVKAVSPLGFPNIIN